MHSPVALTWHFYGAAVVSVPLELRFINRNEISSEFPLLRMPVRNFGLIDQAHLEQDAADCWREVPSSCEFRSGNHDTATVHIFDLPMGMANSA
ncbi:MAG: hypothetical protein GY820_04640 [Gammaproteobacteria bacterium]|nr:hypothetical protein [Gammaproteobacteria bacterium]